MKRIFSLCLIFLMLITTASFGANAESESTENDSYAYFDFEPKEGEDYTAGEDVTNSWILQHSQPVITDPENQYCKITNEEEGENHFLRFTTNMTEDAGKGKYYRLALDLGQSISFTGKKHISFKFRHNAAEGDGVQKRFELGTPDTRGEFFQFIGETVSVPGGKISACAKNVWHSLDVIMDNTGGQFTYFMDGEMSSKTVIDKKYSCENFSTFILRIYFVGNTTLDTVDIDDIKVEDFKPTTIKSTSPQNGGTQEKPTDKITVECTRKIVDVTNAVLYINGEAQKANVEIDALNPKKVTFSLNAPLEVDMAYTVKAENVIDYMGNEAAVEYGFKTRERMLLVDEPTFSTVGSETTVTVKITNEQLSDDKEAAVILASFNGKELKDIAWEHKTIKANDEKYFSPKLTGAEESSLKVYTWDSLTGMNPLEIQPKADGDGASVTAVLDYVTGEGKTEGKLYANAKATIIMTRPDIKISDITENGNIKDKISYISEIICDETGSFYDSFKLNLPQSDSGKSITVYLGGAQITPKTYSFKYYDTKTVAAVLNALKSAKDGEEVKDLLSGAKLVELEDDKTVKANDVLSLSVEEGSDYSALTDKAAVGKALCGKAYDNMQSVWNDFSLAVAEQKTKEAKIYAALSDLNDAGYDELEEKITTYATLLGIDLSGENYTELAKSKDAKTRLFKELANDYTFTFFGDLTKDIENLAEDILKAMEEESQSTYKGGGGGGGGGSKIKTDAAVLAPIYAEKTSAAFKDLQTVPWAEESILYLASKNVLNGVDGENFEPNGKLTREQLVKILVLAGEIPVTESETNFNDVPDNAWYKVYVGTAVKSGLVTGIDENLFGSGENVTREDMAVLLNRLANKLGKILPKQSSELYNDDSEISDYAKEAVYKLCAANIMTGDGSGNFEPKAEVTRAMAAKAVHKLLAYGN